VRGPFCMPIRGPDCLPFDTPAILVRSNLLLFGIATIVAVLSLKDAPFFLIE
jgi:hypothetical protein